MDSLFTSPAASLSQLTEKYRPLDLASFVGLDKVKRLCASICANPFPAAYLFTGDPGLGKTTVAMALAAAIPAELHHIPSQECNLDTLRRVIASCHYVPAIGYLRHLVLVDEADQMTSAAQLYLLSKLDSTSFPPDTIFVFTCNETAGLLPRFLSRCMTVIFSAYGNAKEVADMLESIWNAEAPQGAERPNFARIVKENCGNIRACLMALQTLILMA